jgi:hypothetical protein
MFVDMDVYRNRTHVCVMDNKGNELRNRNVANDRALLAGELSGEDVWKSIYEARAGSQPRGPAPWDCRKRRFVCEGPLGYRRSLPGAAPGQRGR